MHEADESARQMLAEVKRGADWIVEAARLDAERIRWHDEELAQSLDGISTDAIRSLEPVITRLVDGIVMTRSARARFREQVDAHFGED